jgi:hypothetical protein
MGSHHHEEKSNLMVGLAGLGIGIVWIAIVSVIAYQLAAH